MSEVASSILLVLALTVWPLLVFLAVLYWRKGSAQAPNVCLSESELEANWRKSLSDSIYAAIGFLLISILTCTVWLRTGANYQGAFPFAVAPIVCFAAALIHLHVAANQIRLGWPQARSTAWARRVLKNKLPPEEKNNESPITFGENGAVLK